jgi:DNA-binding NarL/FixJ family response regulator
MRADLSNRAQPDVRVLVCDDYPAMRVLLREIIEVRPGMTAVGEAADGYEAIAEAKRLQPDVIVLDLAMPRKTGLAAIREIGRVAPAAKVIIFSGFSIASVGNDASALGAVLYLQKGASPEAILEAIEVAATQSPPVAPYPAIASTALE